MRYIYPAIFTYKRNQGVYVADFPDIAGCSANGKSMEEAMNSARLALCRMLLELEEKSEFFPPPSNSTLLRLKNRGCTICMVVADTAVTRLEREQRMKEASLWNQTKEKAGYSKKLSRVFEFKI